MAAAFITTIKERCRMCYTCVRECPAKAIRIADGQAEVIAERCIACGNCVRVCSQAGQAGRSSIDAGRGSCSSLRPTGGGLPGPELSGRVHRIDYRQLVGMLRALGFQFVHEVAFGADLVAREYARLLANVRRPPATFDHLPGHRRLRRTVLSRPGRLPGPIVSPMIALRALPPRAAGGT